jgi:hypothetical protein
LGFLGLSFDQSHLILFLGKFDTKEESCAQEVPVSFKATQNLLAPHILDNKFQNRHFYRG